MIPSRSLLFAIAAIVTCPLSGFSQAVVSPLLQVTPKADGNQTREISVHAAGAPDPLLAYRFWPEPGLRQNENATPLVSRAAILLLKVPEAQQKEFAEKYQTWSDMPIDELPADEIREFLVPYESSLAELQRAENLMVIDYPLQLEGMTAPELVQTLLPEFQEMRNLARLLQLRARLAILEQRWDDMVADCRVGFRLAEVASHSTDFLIGRLVGFAIASTMMDVIETAIQQPQCPNLYWALACLPADRLFETRESLEFESVLITRIFSGIGKLPDHPIGAASAREKFRKVVDQANHALFDANAAERPKETADLLAGAYVVMMADPSRDLLATTTHWGQEAYKLSAAEAVLRATILKYTRARDRWVAWTMLPAGLWDDYEPEWKEAVSAVQAHASDPLVSLMSLLLPAVNAARTAGRRTEQFRNWLMTIEAIRMHAAETGKLPASIDGLRPVPAWIDTLTNQPFGYQRTQAQRAILSRSARYPDDPETTVHILLKDSTR